MPLLRLAVKESALAHNLFIAYDLDSPGQNYDAVRDAIKSLGRWHQFQMSLFYVSTERTPHEAYLVVNMAMDKGDKLAVIDAQMGLVTTWDKPPIDAINAIWSVP
jgi:hypothetical protein